MNSSQDRHPFLHGGGLHSGGEMGARMRAFDWASHPLGPPEGWPQGLKSAISILLGSRYPMFVWWGSERWNFHNDAYRPVLGARDEWALGRPAASLWEEIWDVVGPQAELVFGRGEATWDAEQPLVMTRNGYVEETFFTYSYSPLVGDDGRVEGLFCACTEDTARVLADRRVRALRELSAAVVDARGAERACELAAEVLRRCDRDVAFALLYLDDEGGSSARLQAVAGISREHPCVPAELAPGEPDPRDRLGIGAALREARAEHRTGLDPALGLPGGAWPEPATDVAVLPLRTVPGARPAGVLVLGASPRREFDDSYRGFFDLVASGIASGITTARAYAAERRRAEELAELDRAKTRFFSNVSHEFRTPLTLMLGPLEEALRGEGATLVPGARELVALAHANGLRLLGLVNALLDFSRIEAGRLRATFAPTDLARFSAEIASAFRAPIERAGLALEVDCPPLGEPVFVDPDLWEKVLLNLLSNALKFTFEGRVRVALRREGGCAALSVSDTGTGIPAEALGGVFERFHRVPGARARTQEGSGIGLSLVKELVDLHGGGVAVESEPGRGSTFTVRVPLGSAHLPAAQLAEARDARPTTALARAAAEQALYGTLTAEPEPPPTQPRSSRASVLLVEDNADMREYVRRILVGAGLAVRPVADGAQALLALRDEPFDLVLCDVMMPNVDGYGLLAALRADPRTRELPVVVLSARAGEEGQAEGLQRGAHDYLVKPFSSTELVTRVRAQIERARERAEATRALRASETELAAELADAKLLQRVSAAMVQQDDAQGLYERIADAAAALMRSDFVSLQKLEPGGELRLLAQRGLERRAAEGWQSVSAKDGTVCAAALRSGARTIVPDVHAPSSPADARTREAFRRAGIRSVTTTPLYSRSGAMVGMLSAQWRASHEPDERRLRSLDILSRQAADLIERADAQAALRARTAQHETLLGQAPLGVYLVDSDLRILEVNPVAEPVFAELEGGVVGRELGEVVRAMFSPAFADEVVAAFRRTLETGEPHVAPETSELRVDRGVREHYEWRVDRIALPDGRHGLVCYFRDISQHVLARTRIAESEKRYRSLVSVITDVPWTTDPSGAFAVPQDVWMEYTGQSWDEARGSGWAEALHPDDRGAFLASWRESCASGGAFSAEGRLWRAASRSYRHVEARATPVRGEGGEIVEWVGTCTDVHERKSLEALRARTLAHERQARREAERVALLKDEFLATLSHELRTPLNAVLGWCQLLRHDIGNAERAAHALGVIERNGRAQAQLIADLLDMSRITSGKMRLDVGPLHLSVVVDAAVESMRPAAEAKGVQLVADVQAIDEAVQGDASRLQQCVWNLIANAVKFTPRGGEIRVSLARRDECYEVRVADTGEGIAPEFLPSLFERFRQADASTTRRHGGLGLGLALVKQLVEMHGGRARAESPGVGRGSTFTIELPRPAAAAPVNGAANGAPESAAGDDALRGVRVLLVEDDPDTLELLARMLGAGDAQLSTAPSARDALRELSGSAFDVIVSDIGMPDGDGYELIGEARRRGIATPALALTAFARAEDRERALRSGFQAYLAKPVEEAELIAAVASLAAARS